uniref:Uncharacterized protein n=1 Tax=Cacopsylla melanoneura TaxID=428564 RepID=A0A8D8SXG5_9HEMI
MFSVQALIVLVIVTWYSLIIMKSTNSYYKEAYQKHLEEENKAYDKGQIKQMDAKCEDPGGDKAGSSEIKEVDNKIEAELLCNEEEDVDVCYFDSKEALIYDKMYKRYP